MTAFLVLKVFAIVASIVGTIIFTFDQRKHKTSQFWGFLLYFLSNISFIVFFTYVEDYGMLVLNLVFIIVSSVGMRNGYASGYAKPQL